MSRIYTSYRRHRYYIVICCLFVFIVGQCYLQAFVRIQCLKPNEVNEPFYEHFLYRTINTCTINRSNIFLTIAVLSSFERLTIYLPLIVNTWALTTTKEIEIILFLEEYSFINNQLIKEIFNRINSHGRIQACLYIVQLKHVDNNYPPQKKSFYSMKYLHIFYRTRTSWILRLDDNAYVNIEKLFQWLKSIDHQRILYVGQSGSGRRNGPAIHFPKGQYFCMGGSGVILSQRTLIELGPWLDHCLSYEILTKHEDVELGRCILSHLQIGCTNAYDSKSLFYHHYGPGYSFGYDFTIPIISQALIIHPMKDLNTFYQLFAFYTRNKQHVQKLIPSSISRINQNYVTFLSKIEFDLVRDIHYQTIDARWHSYIKEIIRLYMAKLQMLWYKRLSQWASIKSSFLLGYHRVIPSKGLELIVEIRLNAEFDNKSLTNIVAARKRLHFRQTLFPQNRLNYREIHFNHINQVMSQLNVIVTSSNKDAALKRFVENFEREVLIHPIRYQYITLTILYFPFNNQTNDELIQFIRRLIVRYVSPIRLSIIEEKNIRYNRGLGRHLASNLFSADQILFFLDVDIGFTGQALDNTRRLMIHQLLISNCTVYFPIIFSSFSHLFIDDAHILEIVDDNHGLFSIYGFGNVAVRKRDLDRIGGWETNNHDWGNEDVNLFQRFSNPSAECNIFRAAEPGLRHFYHKKMCNGITNIERRKICYDADIILLGSQTQMMNYLVNQKLIDY